MNADSGAEQSSVGGADDPAAIVDDVAQLARTAFADLDFLGPRGELAIVRPLPKTTKIRIQLPGTQFLQLHSVELFGEGLTDPVAQTTRTASSYWKDFERLLAEGRLFDGAGTHQKGFHTGKDDQPWLDIAFARPTDLSHIVIRNADTHTSLRARGIQVLAEGADGHTTMLYDGRDRARRFAETIESMCTYSSWSAEPGRAELARLLGDIVAGDSEAADKRLKAIDGISPADQKAVRDRASRSLLAARKMEWTSHGIRRSFRFWSEGERRRYTGFTVETVRDLESLTPQVCFGFGSVLAVVREGALIKHDDDLDVIIGFEPHEASTLAEARALVTEHLTALGYKVSGDHLAHVFVTKGDQVKIDVFVGLFEGDDIAWYPGTRGSLQRHDMFPTSEGMLLGHRCPLPRNPLIYLEKVYGRSWRVPDPGFIHKWRRRPYDDISGLPRS